MIITCNKCSTSFNLDNFLIKEDGSKCRCSVCKNVFTVYPLPGESKQKPEKSPGLNLELETDDEKILEEPSPFEMEDSNLELEDSDFEIDDTDLDPGEADLEVDEDFSFEESEFEIDEDAEPQELELEENPLEFDDTPEENLDSIEFEPIDDETGSFDIEEDEPDLEMEKEPDIQDMDSKAQDLNLHEDSIETEDEFELEFDVEEDFETKTPEIEEELEDAHLEIETRPDDDDLSLSLEEDKQEETPPVITPEDEFSKYDEILEQETEPEPEDGSLDEETIKKDETPKDETPRVQESRPVMKKTSGARRRRKKKKTVVGTPVLILLLIFLLIAGAYIASIMTGYKIPYLSDIKIPVIEQYLKKAQPEPSKVKPVPNQKSVNGRFVTNSTAGTLFVITGRVENPSNIALSHIEIRGALITKGKVKAKTKNAFCGNIITEEMLKTGNIADINKLLAVKAGNHNSNVNIKPGSNIPFMVVFSNLPEKLQNFTIKVINFEKAKKQP
ncbi:MAG: DUF3426 domain-containing protein [Deltaproteobacteria bacterium]|nr:DUF3426 domain-containing protein [Deltaproteobacteria bacterium]